MSSELRILILEDVTTDFELIVDELQESGFVFTAEHVATRPDYVHAISTFSPDLILSDYALPSFDGMSALKIAQENCSDVPFIFVSGAVGEEKAIELLTEGATDYVLKHRLSRLGPAVSRALKEVAERRERQRIETALRDSETYYRTIFENTGTATIISENYETILLANRQFELLSGFSMAEIEGRKTWQEFIHPEDRAKARDRRRTRRTKTDRQAAAWEFRVINRQGEILNVIAKIATIPATRRIVISLLDVTALKQAEQKILATNDMLRFLTSELVMAEERERRRISIELHDQIAQTLALAKLETDSVLNQASGSGLEAPLARIGDLLRQSIQQTRSLMRDISPSVLYELGFAEAVLWLADQYQSKHGLQVVVENGLGKGRIDQDLQVFLFRALRELLMNVVKHARVERAFVTLQQAGESVVMSVRDDGSGFNFREIPQGARDHGGFGLFSLRERVRYLGGRFEIESQRGQGTLVRLLVPKKVRKKKTKGGMLHENQGSAG